MTEIQHAIKVTVTATREYGEPKFDNATVLIRTLDGGVFELSVPKADLIELKRGQVLNPEDPESFYVDSDEGWVEA